MAERVIQALEQTSLAKMVENMGVAIAQAQYRLDQTSVEIGRLMGSEESRVRIGDRDYSLLELGFSPTFYHMTETTVEAKVAFSSAQSQEFSFGVSVGASVGFFAAMVSASYSGKYSFEASASSSISTRFVSVPPPAVFAERLQQAAADGTLTSEPA